MTRWTADEDATLARVYPLERRNAILAALPGRTWAAINLRAFKRGIARTRHGAWTPAEDAELARMWPEHSRDTIVRNLPGRSWFAIFKRARQLGVLETRWRGYVAIYRAAELTGYSPRTFLRILAEYQAWWAEHGNHESGINPVLTNKAPSRGRQRVQRMVDAQAAIEAAEWWLSR